MLNNKLKKYVDTMPQEIDVCGVPFKIQYELNPVVEGDPVLGSVDKHTKIV